MNVPKPVRVVAWSGAVASIAVGVALIFDALKREKAAVADSPPVFGQNPEVMYANYPYGAALPPTQNV